MRNPARVVFGLALHLGGGAVAVRVAATKTVEVGAAAAAKTAPAPALALADPARLLPLVAHAPSEVARLRPMRVARRRTATGGGGSTGPTRRMGALSGSCPWAGWGKSG